MNVRKAHSNSYVCKLARAPRAYLGQHWERVRAAARWNERLSMCWCHLTSAVNVTEPSRLYQCIRSCLACIWFNGECCCCGYSVVAYFPYSCFLFRIVCSAQSLVLLFRTEQYHTIMCAHAHWIGIANSFNFTKGHTANPFQTLASHTLTHAYTHASKMKTGKQPDYNSFGERPRWNERKRHGSTFVCPLHCRNNDRLAFVSACTISAFVQRCTNNLYYASDEIASKPRACERARAPNFRWAAIVQYAQLFDIVSEHFCDVNINITSVWMNAHHNKYVRTSDGAATCVF